MLTSILINLIITAIITPSVSGVFNFSGISPEPITLESGGAIAGAQASSAPARANLKSRGLKLTAKSALVIDKDSGGILFERNKELKMPIASISKLMTALVFLDTNPDWDREIAIEKSDEAGGARVRVGLGENVRAEDLFYASLVGSANNATMALARSTGFTAKDFMVLMNKKAKELGLANSYFAEPTGLSAVNYSTASDVGQLIKAALAKEEIQRALKMKEYRFKTVNSQRWVYIKNTDRLLDSFLNNGDGYEILGGKTGFTNEAGYCLGLSVKNKKEHEIIIVVLGAENIEARFQEAKSLTWWTFNNWVWE